MLQTSNAMPCFVFEFFFKTVIKQEIFPSFKLYHCSVFRIYATVFISNFSKERKRLTNDEHSNLYACSFNKKSNILSVLHQLSQQQKLQSVFFLQYFNFRLRTQDLNLNISEEKGIFLPITPSGISTFMQHQEEIRRLLVLRKSVRFVNYIK